MQIDALNFLKESKAHINKKFNEIKLYLILGEEIYFINQVKKQLLDISEKLGFEQKFTAYVTNSFNWNEVFSEINQQVLFASNKLIDLQLEISKLDVGITKNLNKLLTELCNLSKKNINNNLLVITFPHKIDAKSLKQDWFKEITSSGLIINANSLYQNQFISYIQQYCRRYVRHSIIYYLFKNCVR